MTVDELIGKLLEISEKGGGNAISTIYAISYWSDEIVTFLVGKAPLISEIEEKPHIERYIDV
jgi:hypothetical protein